MTYSVRFSQDFKGPRRRTIFLVAFVVASLAFIGFVKEKKELTQFRPISSTGIIRTELATSFQPTNLTTGTKIDNHTYALQQTTVKETKEQVTFQPTNLTTGNYGELYTKRTDNPEELQQCRLDLEKWLNPKIDEWVGTSMPILDWVWEMEENNTDGTSQQYYLASFISYHIARRDASLRSTTWYCLDEFGNSLKTVVLKRGQQSKRMFIRCDLEAPLNRTDATSFSPVTLMPADVPPLMSDHKKTEYDLRPFLKCDRLEQRSPPPPDVKVGACVRVRGDHEALRQWIEYHRLIGMQHFWIFLNEPFDIHDLPNASDVTYIPYNYVWRDHWGAQRGNTTFRAPYGGTDFWQTPSQSQCLYMTKRYGLDWFTTTDVDEYIWITDPIAMNSIDPPPVQAFLSQFSDRPDLGSLRMDSVAFGRNTKVEPISKEFELIVDYTCRKIRFPKPGVHFKQFWKSQVALDLTIHFLTEGGKTLPLDVASQARIHHFKQPWKGPHMAGNLPANELMNDTSLPDKYRKSILQGLDSYRAKITGIA
jgi:hypothetical protein